MANIENSLFLWSSAQYLSKSSMLCALVLGQEGIYIRLLGGGLWVNALGTRYATG